MFESKKSQQDMFKAIEMDERVVPDYEVGDGAEHMEMSKVESELLGYSNFHGDARILYPTAEQERLMNLRVGADYH